MILAIDTATRWLGVALHDGTAVLAELGWRCLNNHTTELAPTIQEMMTRVGVQAADLSGIAVAIGPGSYTGLRVGLAMAKGLALPFQTPILDIPTLDIVATQVPQYNGRLFVIAEAGRTRICIGEYRWHTDVGWLAKGQPQIESWQTVLAETEGQTLFAGEISEKTAVKIKEANPKFEVALGGTAVRRAGNLAELGWRKLRQGEAGNTAHLAPTYLRDPAGA